MNIVYGFLLLLCSLSAYASEDAVLDVNGSKKNFVVNLDANPTTGYQWSVVRYDKRLFTLSKSEYQHPKTNLIGSGGQMVFTFKLNKGKVYPQKTEMVFKYARAWEPGSAIVRKLTIHFVSGDKGVAQSK